jgi:hypothetical protein
MAQIKALGAFRKRIVLKGTVSLRNSRERLEMGHYRGSEAFFAQIYRRF